MTKRDFTQIALDVVKRATGEAEEPMTTAKQEAGRKGGKKGGKGRMDSLTPEQRHELAVKAASARWSKTAPGPVGTGAGKGSKGG